VIPALSRKNALVLDLSLLFYLHDLAAVVHATIRAHPVRRSGAMAMGALTDTRGAACMGRAS
jgi:hypothetical protein